MPTAAGIYFTVHEGGQVDHPPVVLLHGAGGSNLDWPAELRRLVGQRVLALDLPGHGKSAGTAQQTVSAYVEQIQAFLTELGLNEVVLAGHSLGGAIALELARRYPFRVAGLGLISTGACFQVDPGLLEDLSGPVTVLQGLNRLRRQAFSSSTRPAVVEAWIQSLAKTRPSLLLADWKACAGFDIRDGMDQISAPAWILSGQDDSITPPAFARFLSARLPEASMQIIAGCGHMLPLEMPLAVAQGLSDFLVLRLPAIMQHCLMLRDTYVIGDSQPVSRENLGRTHLPK